MVLLAVIAIVCAVLSLLQYGWTGELSKAEPVLLRASLNDQLRLFARDFNNEIREACVSLVPGTNEVDSAGPDALSDRYTQWASSHDRKLFLRIAMASAKKEGLALYGIDAAGRTDATAWPAEWEELRAAMVNRLNGSGRPPNVRPESNLIELPIFASSGSEAGWLIYELNTEYLRSAVLPRFVSEYLSPQGAKYDVSVSPGTDTRVIFSTLGNGASVTEKADATTGLLPLGLGTAGRAYS